MSWAPIARNNLAKQGHKCPFRERIADALRPYPAKIIARMADATEKAALRWKAGDNAPGAEALCRLARHIDDVWREMQIEACRTDEEAAAILAEFTERLAQRKRSE